MRDALLHCKILFDISVNEQPFARFPRSKWGDGTNLLNDANHCLTYWEDFSVKHDAISISNLGGGGENEVFSYLEGKKKSANYVESFERHPKSL